MVAMAELLEIRPNITQIWDWLEGVSDPEIPVLSVVDLGIIRGVEWKNSGLLVEITPTYSGCPATSVIALDIETALLKRGIEHIDIQTKLSPVWTTDWISQAGRDKLKAYGIAPPVKGASCAGMIKLGGAQTPEVACPRCASKQTERISQFGSTPCKAAYRCTSCLEPFDYFKSF